MRFSSLTAASTASGSVQNGGTICAFTIIALVSSQAVISATRAVDVVERARQIGPDAGMHERGAAFVVTTLCDRSHRPYLPRGPSASTYSRNPGGWLAIHASRFGAASPVAARRFTRRA